MQIVKSFVGVSDECYKPSRDILYKMPMDYIRKNNGIF